jgi:stress-induced morphogen
MKFEVYCDESRPEIFTTPLTNARPACSSEFRDTLLNPKFQGKLRINRMKYIAKF